jgi:hypothetical protein
MNSIPKDVIQVLRNPELTPYKRMIAYTMLMTNLPADPAHAAICRANLELGKRIKELIENGTLTVTGMKENSFLCIETS